MTLTGTKTMTTKDYGYVYIVEDGITKQYACPKTMVSKLEVLDARSTKLFAPIIQAFVTNGTISQKLLNLSNRASKLAKEYKAWCIAYAQQYPIR